MAYGHGIKLSSKTCYSFVCCCSFLLIKPVASRSAIAIARRTQQTTSINQPITCTNSTRTEQLFIFSS
jgi:hypothetical protein